jgi:hypothetical protein
MDWKLIIYKSIEDLNNYFEPRFSIRYQPTESRWGIVSTLVAISSSSIAIGVAFWAIAIALLGGVWGYCMQITAIVIGSLVIVLGIFLIGGGIWGLIRAAQLMEYWLTNSWESDTHKLIRGIAKGVIDKHIPDIEKLDAIEQFGIRVGRHAEAIMKEREASIKTTSKEN